MCLICIEYEKQRLTTREALRNLGEMIDSVGPEHAAEVVKKVLADVRSVEVRPDRTIVVRYWNGINLLFDPMAIRC